MVNSLAPTKSLTTYTTSVRDWYGVNPSNWAEDGSLHISGIHTIGVASVMVNSLAPTKSLTTYTTSVRGWYGVNPSIWAENGSLHVPGIHTVKMAAVTDPKSVEWLRRVDLDQVISTFRQMQQFNSRNQENSEQTPKISSSLLGLPNSQAPMPLTVTDPKNVKWLRLVTRHGVDPDQVISTFRQMQQFNSRKPRKLRTNAQNIVKPLKPPPSEYADRPNPQQHGSTKLTQIGRLRTKFY